MSILLSRGLNYCGIPYNLSNLKDSLEFNQQDLLRTGSMSRIQSTMKQSRSRPIFVRPPPQPPMVPFHAKFGIVICWGNDFNLNKGVSMSKNFTKYPKIFPILQSNKYIASILSMDKLVTQPSILPIQDLHIDEKIIGISFGGASLIANSNKGRIFCIGQNNSGQLGLGEDPIIKNLTLCQDVSGIKQVSQGFEFGLLLDDKNKLYGAGKRNWYQFLAVNKVISRFDTVHEKKFVAVKTPDWEGKVTDVICGFRHTFVIMNHKSLFFSGFNYFGESGVPRFEGEIMENYKEIGIPLMEGELIKEMECGKGHNILLTSYGRVFTFGSTINRQIPFIERYELIESTGPQELDLPLKQNNVVKVRAGINKSAIIYDNGVAYQFGEGIGTLENPFEVMSEDENIKISDIALGFRHDLMVINVQK